MKHLIDALNNFPIYLYQLFEYNFGNPFWKALDSHYSMISCH